MEDMDVLLMGDCNPTQNGINNHLLKRSSDFQNWADLNPITCSCVWRSSGNFRCCRTKKLLDAFGFPQRSYVSDLLMEWDIEHQYDMGFLGMV